MDEISAEDLQNPALQGLNVGDIAPDFIGIDACNPDNPEFVLSSQLSKHRGSLLLFFRGAW